MVINMHVNTYPRAIRLPCVDSHFELASVQRGQLHRDCWPYGEHGPNLGYLHMRTLGDGLFEIHAKGAEGIERALFYT